MYHVHHLIGVTLGYLGVSSFAFCVLRMDVRTRAFVWIQGAPGVEVVSGDCPRLQDRFSRLDTFESKSTAVDVYLLQLHLV